MAIREVIFRGKRTDNGEWVEGSLLGIDWCDKPSTYSIAPNTPVSVFYSIIPETVGQHTGLTDKNGKKIFEGDIIEVEGEKWCVGYDDMRARFVLFHTSWELMRNIPNYCEREVIGNIHDNPEILKGGGDNG